MLKSKSLRLNLTKTILEGLLADHEGERLTIHDKKQPGLVVDLRAGGTLAFYLYKWHDGRPHRIRIGAFPEVTVDQAREQTKLLLADLVKGIDPAAVRRKRRTEPTLKDLFTHWLETHAKLHKRTWEGDQWQFDNLLKGWHNRRLSTIKLVDVRALHAKQGRERGPYIANRMLALLRAMFNRAAEIGYEGINPAKGIKKFKEQSRDRFLQPSELPAFFAACDAEPDDTLRDFFKICLFTGARRGNVQAMTWDQLDLGAATWRIPVTKSGEPVTVCLPTPAVEILAARKASASGSPYVFPGGKKNRAGHLQDPKAAWKRLCERGGFSDLRMHDLRRTLGSFQAAAGASLQVIGKSLGHKSQQSTAVYARLNLDPVRASVDVAVAAIVAAGIKEGKRE